MAVLPPPYPSAYILTLASISRDKNMCGGRSMDQSSRNFWVACVFPFLHSYKELNIEDRLGS